MSDDNEEDHDVFLDEDGWIETDEDQEVSFTFRISDDTNSALMVITIGKFHFKMDVDVEEIENLGNKCLRVAKIVRGMARNPGSA